MTMPSTAQQRPLFADPLQDFLQSLLPPPEAAPAPPAWVWLCGDFSPMSGPDVALRVCCEPTTCPEPAAWRLTAWERVVGKQLYCRYRDGLQFGQLNLRLPPPTLAAGVERVRHLKRQVAAPGLDLAERQRLAELLAQTRRGVESVWRDDCVANVHESLVAIAAIVPRVLEVGHVDRGTYLMCPEDYTPPVADPDHWHVLKLALRRDERGQD
jgi:hypothetical protein